MTTSASAKDKIIVPLDVPGAAEAVRLVGQLSGIITYYKIGLELFTRCGPGIVGEVRVAADGPCRIFLDLKLHDIPNTVLHAVRAAAALEIDMLTVHLSGGGAMLRAAASEAGDKLLLLGVSVLTSSDEATLRETGVEGSVEAQVLRLAALGLESGLRGVVASPLEIRVLRSQLGAELKIVTPGVRPASASSTPDDQRRVLTPAQAIQAGADFLVIGRPITAQPDPRQAAQNIVDSIGSPMIGDQAPLFARLEVIDDPCPHAAALNMATDEALLASLADTPLLRIYRWARAAVSFGYFDEFERVRRTWIGRDFVRRWTGGGVVEHGQDFTYSLLVPRAHPLTALRAQESYRLLHENVARAVAKAGPDLPGLTAEGGAAASRQTTRACFDHAVRHDLLLHGDKVAGAAQRRTRRGWLHQGSVNLPGETAILYQRLRQTLPSELAGEFCSRLMQPGEEAAAMQLVRTKYGTDAWRRRF